MAAMRHETADFPQIVALRIACAGKRGCARADLESEIFELLRPRLSRDESSSRLGAHLQTLTAAGAISATQKGRLAITKKGKRAAVGTLGLSSLPSRNWNEILSVYLVAKALGIKPAARKRLAAIASTDGLRAVILNRYFDLKIKDIAPTSAQIRNALAARALRDDKIADGFPGVSNGSTRLPLKLSLFLACQNLREPRSVSSTEKLIALLAAEAAGADGPDAKSLRLAIVRSFVLSDIADALFQAAQAPATASNGSAATPRSKELDLAKFAVSVHELARDQAEGWAGNKRAFISRVWRTVQARRPDWGLDEDAFKLRLTEAHRAGHLTLTVADFCDKSNIADVKDSVTRYKNAEWHLIRVED